MKQLFLLEDDETLGRGIALALVLLERWRTRRTIRRLDEMITAAMAGRFCEKDFDESRLSSLENRLAQYLTASTLSAGQIQQQKDQLSALISDIAHQTRTPTANLRLYSQLMGEQPLSPQARDRLQAITAQTEKLESLREALVKTSRLEAGVLALHPQCGPIGPVVERALAQYTAEASGKPLTLCAMGAEGTACFDAKWTEEALCILLDNATPAGGRVTVSAKNYELFSAICVCDTGPGIAEEEQARIFQRFYRAPAAYSLPGVGVGLYLARQIAEKQGGYIKVKSRPEQGSSFLLYLPRES